MDIIETKNLIKKYQDLTAVDNLNLEIKRGEIFGLLGPNGAGKTTTISMLCTIINITSGEAYVNGYSVVQESSKVRKSIGIVFQDPSIDDRLTGWENLELHAMLYGLNKNMRKERIKEVLKLVNLEDRANSLMRTYSGGMRRRLELARGFLHYPKILFLDEPTLGLDPQTREYIWTYVENLIKNEDITIVLTTHYMEEADRLCSRIAIIDSGKVLALDTPDSLKSSLSGDVISIKSDNVSKLKEVLFKYEDIKNIILDNDEIRFNVKSAEDFIPKLFEITKQQELKLFSVNFYKPTLNDVFLHYTGREIREDKPEKSGVMFRRLKRMQKRRMN